MSELGVNTEEVMQTYLDNPRRVSILSNAAMLKPSKRKLTEQGLEVDFCFLSARSMEIQREVIRRDGLGTLVVIGEASSTDFDHDYVTRHVPFILDQIGVGDTPTVHVPLRYSQIVGPCPPDEGDYPYTRQLELTDENRFNSALIMEQAAQLIKSLVEIHPEVE